MPKINTKPAKLISITGDKTVLRPKQKKDIDGLMNPDDIASNYLWIHNQPRNAWTHELDLRPWVEKW